MFWEIKDPIIDGCCWVPVALDLLSILTLMLPGKEREKERKERE